MGVYFNLKKTAIFQAIRWGKNPIFKFRRFFAISFFILALVFFASAVSSSGGPSSKFSGGAILSLIAGILFWELNLFFNLKLKKPKLKYSISDLVLRPEDFNLASFLNYAAAAVCFGALKFAKRKKLEGPTGRILFYFLISSEAKEIDFVFARTGLNLVRLKKDLKKELSKIYPVKSLPVRQAGRKAGAEQFSTFKKLVFGAAKIARTQKKKTICPGDLLISLAQFDPFFKSFLVENDLKKEDIENLVCWYGRIRNQITQSKRFWDRDNLLQRGSVGKDFVAGYTITLDKYSLDLREMLRKTGFREIIGHKEEIKRIERILEKKEINNVLLVGAPGTGRDSIVETLAQRAFFGRSSQTVNYKRILKLDLVALAAEITSTEEVEAVLNQCFRETVEAGNIILVIDEFHNFVSETPKPGTVNISGILGRYLSLSAFQIIAVTTYDGLHRIIEKDPTLHNLFEKVEVSEISEDETLIFLENHVPFFERKHKKFINYKALREILRLSSRYLTQAPFPEKAIRLLDEAISYLTIYTKDPVLLEHHIKKVVSEKTEIPIEELETKEKEILLNLEQLIHQRIINQEEAVKQVSAALRRARAEVRVRSGPIGSFLFLGPTGVGKTETSKVLSAIYFGAEERMIRLDMTEFQNIDDVKRLIGSEQGEGLLTTPIRENPFSLLLLDEIEKAHPNILNLFLQVLDEGWVTDGFGRRVDFKNTIIIATSNAGSEVIREDIKEDKTLNMIKDDLLDYLFTQRMFRPEFINRFDAVVVFKPLTKENLLEIAQLMLASLARNLEDKGVELEITQELKMKIVELGYNPVFGAREMRRVIQDKVENVLANAILSGKLKRGNRVRIDAEEFKLIINSE